MNLKFLTAIIILTFGVNATIARTHTAQEEPWQKVAPVGRSFTVLMPAPATQSTRLVSMSARESIPVVMYHALAAGKRYVAAEVSKSENTLSSYEKFVAGMEHSFKNNKSTMSLTFDREISQAGIAGKQYRLAVDQYLGVAHFLRSENAFYLLVIIGADEKDSDAARFLSSFNAGEPNTNHDASGAALKSAGAGVSSPPIPWPALVAPISGGILNGKAIEMERPEYPLAARENGDAGIVRVQILIDEMGNVIQAEAIEGPLSLREAAVKAALKSRFTQTRLSGQAVKVRGLLVYNFVSR